MERVWGGRRLAPPRALPIGELWVVGPWLRVAGGPHAGRTLEEVAAADGESLLGRAARPGAGPRFPLLVKLLDPAAWLSVQVHPDDGTARELEGPAAVGKAEAWYVLAAEPGAEILVGTRPGVTLAEVRAAIELPAGQRGTAVVDLMERVAVEPGDAFMIEAGTLHAVGPGVLLYEVQQPSDLTYRVDDWGRLPTAGRPLHRAQALASVAATGPAARRRGGTGGRLASCRHFALDLVAASATLDPAGGTPHVVTAVGGPATLLGEGWSAKLEPLGSLVVPAASGRYAIEPAAGGRALVASVP